jgi:hypothetical protein
LKNFIYGLLLLFGISSGAFTQVQVGVWTDKSTYDYGDTISIHVTAYNPTKYPMVLNFGSACQASYRIDTFNWIMNVLCSTVLTYAIIPPFQSISWDYLEYPMYGWPILGTGAHNVIGEVLGYGVSQPVQIVVSPVTSVLGEDPSIPESQLGNNYPNPFNGTTIIPYSVSRPGHIKIGIYDALGRVVHLLMDEYSQAGDYALNVNMDAQPSGVYWCRFQHEDKVQTLRLLLTK